MKTLPILAALTAACGLASIAYAQGTHQHDHGAKDHKAMDHGAMDHGAKPAATDTPATRAFRAADARMHEEMAIRYTGDVDVDFVRGMIPHHRGAVAMAKVALEHSKNPEIRKLAEDIVRSQDAEIAFMEKFLKEKAAAKLR